jgi:hypothetical protein
MLTVSRAGTIRLVFQTYYSGQLADPDEFPVGPRFHLAKAATENSAIAGYENIPYANRLSRGVFEFILRITNRKSNLPVLADGAYVVKLNLGSVSSTTLIDENGDVPKQSVTIVPEASVSQDFAPYATTAELFADYGLKDVTEQEVRFSQSLMDVEMNRPTLWPHVYSNKRHDIPQGRNFIQVDYRPVIRIFGASLLVDASGLKGRYTPGRRDRRQLNAFNQDYLAVMATFGVPPRFTAIDVDHVNLHTDTGQIWLPTGYFLVPYSQVEITYEAGCPVIPSPVKRALAEMVEWVRFKGYANLTSYSEGKVSRQTGESFITNSVRSALRPYKTVTLR